MSERRRALPPWMAKKEERAGEKKATVKRRRPKKSKSIFYCMNERELVDAAVSLLTNAAACPDAVLLSDHKVQDDLAGKTSASTSRGNPVMQESSECSDAQDAAHVSETDLDVSQMETMPYTTSPASQEPGGWTSEPPHAQAASRSVGLEAERRKRAADEEEEDELQLVRDIFFSR